MKYTNQQLKEMALQCQQARNEGDSRYLALVLRLAVQTGMAPGDVMARIDALAQ